MPLRIDEVKIETIVRELSTDALSYFAELELSDDWPAYNDTQSGKFVRLGEVILLGAGIDYGELDYRSRRKNIKHIDLLWFCFEGRDEDLRKRVEATAPRDGSYLEEKWPLVDAGWWLLSTADEGSRPTALRIDDRSMDYGSGDEETRNRTGEIAQEVLGSEIAVTASLE